MTPALLVALFQKPQDRVFLIDLENSILDFVESSAYTYQLKPMNSYYRLLSHQVAEYHGLQHTVSKDNDKCVIVFKQNQYEPNERLVLLQQLEPQIMYQFPPEYFALASMAAVNNQQQMMQKNVRHKHRNSYHAKPKAEDADSKSSVFSKKKITILKRESDKNLDGGHSSEQPDAVELEPPSSSSPIDLEADRLLKEKQYNEEKEKIFSSSPSSPTSFSTPPATPAPLNKLVSDEREDDSPQPHQFETSRFKLNNQNEMRQIRRPKFQGYNQKPYNNSYHQKNHHQSHPASMSPYYGMPPQILPLNSNPMAYGYPMMAPMEYMYYPMSAPVSNNQMIMNVQPVYSMVSREYKPYEKRSDSKNDTNGINGGKKINKTTHI